jgi:hypothetical protein
VKALIPSSPSAYSLSNRANERTSDLRHARYCCWRCNGGSWQLSKCGRGQEQTHCHYAPSRTANEWSPNDELLSLIVRGLANFRTNNKSSSEELSSRRSRTISFSGRRTICWQLSLRQRVTCSPISARSRRRVSRSADPPAAGPRKDADEVCRNSTYSGSAESRPPARWRGSFLRSTRR